jgi:hypothetical protein
MSAPNETRQIVKELDEKFTTTLKVNGMAFSIKKVRNCLSWIVQVGKFESMADPYIQGEIAYVYGDMAKQFKEILDQAIADEKVNYRVAPKMEEAV